MKKGWKITLITMGSIVATLLVAAGGYVGYIYFSYYRIGNIDLAVKNNTTNNELTTNKNYKVSTYNIGFGAYSQDFTFFLDTGYDDNGKETCGHDSRAKDKATVEFNVNGAINTIKEQDVDFALFQEVDTSATRSYYINENNMILNAFKDYDSTFAKNFHTGYLPYPLYEMHGKVQAGITTLSRYKITEAKRIQYTVANDFSKLFDLDRCFSYSKIAVDNDKSLYLVNSHMSAYDKGGKIREKQIKELNDFLSARKENGDYVVVGGDFNHDLITYNKVFNYDKENRPFGMTKKNPDWVSFFFDEEGNTPLIDGYTVVAGDNSPTCRNNDIEWQPGKTYTCVVDGFIISDNIEVKDNKSTNIQTKNGNKGLDGFAYSDHEPSVMEFKLKA